jgi:hypothetical protein
MQLGLAKEVVHWLEAALDHRQLASLEELWQQRKLKTLGMSSLQRTISRQESCMLWLHEGDAPTRFFHAHVNYRRHKNFILSLENQGQTIFTEDSKAEAAYSFFSEIIMVPAHCSNTID